MTTIQNIRIELASQREKVIPRRKLIFAEKLKSLLDEYSTCLVIQITNIGSKQIAEMRKEFRGKARFLFGKNTLIRKVIRDYVKKTKNKKLMKLMDLIKGNIGLVFTKNEINPIRKEIIKTKKQCPARVGGIAPIDVFIPIGPTNMEPRKTSIFQDMDISTRINKGQIDVISEKHLIKKGEKIGASEASLLSQLNIKPFYYGVTVKSIYDNGTVIKDCDGMDMSINDIAQSFYNGIQQIAALCFTLKYPTIINVPHSILNAYKKTLGLSLMLETYSWNGLEDVENALDDAEKIKDQQQKPVIDNDNDSDDDTGSASSVGVNPFDSSSSDESSSDEEN